MGTSDKSTAGRAGVTKTHFGTFESQFPTAWVEGKGRPLLGGARPPFPGCT